MFHVEQLLKSKQKEIDFFVNELLKWQKTTNLISSGSALSYEEIFSRHVLDSAQIVEFVGVGAENIADFGSGAGFPGIIISLLLDNRVDLYESNIRKAEFLKYIILKLGLSSSVINDRIEKYKIEIPYQVITSRAMASLSDILQLSIGKYNQDTKFILHKGKNYESEINELDDRFEFNLDVKNSITDKDGKIIVLWGVHGKSLCNS